MTDALVRILLLEDDPAHAELVQRAFEYRGGVKLTVAGTLARARAQIEAELPHLIIADWRLPDGEGIDLLSDHGSLQNVPIVLMTSYGNEKIAVEAMKAGALDYVVKSEETLVDMPHIAERAIRQWTMISEKVRIEASLRENEERFRSFIEQSAEGVALLDEQGRIIEWNQSSTQITGLTRDQAMGAYFWDVLAKLFVFQSSTGDDYESLKGKYQHTLQTGESIYFDLPQESVIRKSMGEQRIIQQSVFPIKTAHGYRIGSVLQDVTDRRQRERELQAIASLSAAMRSAPSRRDILPIILDEVIRLMSADAASLEMLSPVTGEAVIELAHGLWSPATGVRIPRGFGLNAMIEAMGKPYLNNDLPNDSKAFLPELTRLCRAGSGVPLIAQEQTIGFLWIGRQTEITSAEVRLLVAMADIAANAILRSTLYEQTQRDAIELAEAYDATIEGWSRVMDLRDNETEGHSQRVAELAVSLGRALGMLDVELLQLRRGALLHDLGKMAVPDHILRKPGPLDDDEWRVMRQHPEYAYNMLAQIAYLHPALDVPYYHHERWDGKGYPRGLKAEQIPLTARIFAIVDVWDALRSDRPYRRSWSKNAVTEYLLEQRGTHFDPQVVDGFMKLIHQGLAT